MARTSIRTALFALTALAVIAIAAPAATATPRVGDLQCGVLPTTDVRLRSDLTCATGFHFPLAWPPVSIDLGGHTLTVPAPAGICVSGGSCGAILGAAAVTNGTVDGTLVSIRLISRVHVRGNIEMNLSPALYVPDVLERSEVDGTVRMWGPNDRIDRNIIRGVVGFNDTDTGIANASITRNRILGGGIAAQPMFPFPRDMSGVISDNVISGSTSAGIFLGGDVAEFRIEGNWVEDSGGDGIHVGTPGNVFPFPDGGPVTIRDNTAVNNRGHGIDAEAMSGPEVTVLVDGGRNHARGNGLDPACIGVACQVPGGEQRYRQGVV